MGFLKLNMLLAISTAVQHPAKWLLIPLVLALSLVGSQLPIFISDISPFVPQLISTLFGKEVPLQIPLVLVSYALLISCLLAQYARWAFLCSVKLYNRHNVIIPT